MQAWVEMVFCMCIFNPPETGCIELLGFGQRAVLVLGERRKRSGEIKLERHFHFYMGSLECKLYCGLFLIRILDELFGKM